MDTEKEVESKALGTATVVRGQMVELTTLLSPKA
jgi:hypothetical protein